jgi:hypothetical protein
MSKTGGRQLLFDGQIRDRQATYIVNSTNGGFQAVKPSTAMAYPGR